jgi:hypothetical protein
MYGWNRSIALLFGTNLGKACVERLGLIDNGLFVDYQQ